MRLIRQEAPQGCAVACLAMILGKTYADVLSNFDRLPADGYTVHKILRKHGYVPQLEFMWKRPPPYYYRELPMLLHTWVGHEGGPSHVVLLLDDGQVLDPDRDESRTLADYPLLWGWTALCLEDYGERT